MEKNVYLNDKTRLPRAAAGKAGVDPAGMQAFLDYIEREQIRMNSVMVLRHGAVVYEGYWAPYRADLPHALHSVTKTLVSTAFGLLIAEGKITLDTKVVPFFPDYEIQMDENWDALAVRHLLSMTCGHDRAYPFLDREDYQEAFFAHPLTHKPGTFFCYTNLCTYTLCNILKRLTGQNLQEFLRERLLEPMGIGSFTCGVSPTGVSHGASLGFLTTEDMAKFGLLYLNRGRWGDRQLLPAEWVEQASSVQIADTVDCDFENVADSMQGYGFKIWRCTQPGAYRFYGIFGQHILVLPEQDAVIVTTGGHTRSDEILRGVWEYLLPALRDDCTADEVLEKAVEKHLGELQVLRTDGLAESPLAGEWSGKWMRFAENRDAFLPAWLMANRAWPKAAADYDGVHGCKLDFAGTDLTLTLREGALENRWALKTGGELTEITYRTHVGEYAVALRANWTAPTVLIVEMIYLNYAQHARVEFVFGETETRVLLHETPFGEEYKTKETRELTAVFA